jgi:type II secretory pathway pseudopilin PulG
MSPCIAIRRSRAASFAAVRGGVTLIELLVVITILMMITAAAIPLIAPSVQNRRVREATRLVSSYFAAARARAAETGRPVGVMIQGFTAGLASSTSPTAGTTNYNFSMNLSMVETPVPYAGDTVSSQLAVLQPPFPTNPPAQLPWPPPSPPPSPPYFHAAYYSQLAVYLPSTSVDAWAAQNIRVGDAIRFNYRGPFYYFDKFNQSTSYPITNSYITLPAPILPASGTMIPQAWTVGLWSSGVGTTGNQLDPNSLLVQNVETPAFVVSSIASTIPSTQTVPYQIFRQPVRSAVDPLQLPEGIVIDLQCSGMSTGTSGTYSGVFSGAASPIIMFSPKGNVELIYDNGPQRATGTIYLLLGRREQTVASSSIAYPNLADLNSLWVAIAPQTGKVLTAENGSSYVDPSTSTTYTNNGGGSPPTTATNFTHSLYAARSLAAGFAGVVTAKGGN